MAVADAHDAGAQEAFAAAVCQVLRESRRRQKLTQAQVAEKTGGLVSKAALANYETGHRSLRVDVLWVIARALREDIGTLLTAAERGIGRRLNNPISGAITIDVAEVLNDRDTRLEPVRRWFELRGDAASSHVTLDDGAIRALAGLMNVSPQECRQILSAISAVGDLTGEPVAAGDHTGL